MTHSLTEQTLESLIVAQMIAPVEECGGWVPGDAHGPHDVHLFYPTPSRANVRAAERFAHT